MVVIFEFFRESPNDRSRVNIATEKRNIETAGAAVSYALGAVNNVVFDGAMVDGCSLKSEKGMLVYEVRRDAHQR